MNIESERGFRRREYVKSTIGKILAIGHSLQVMAEMSTAALRSQGSRADFLYTKYTLRGASESRNIYQRHRIHA